MTFKKEAVRLAYGLNQNGAVGAMVGEARRKTL